MEGQQNDYQLLTDSQLLDRFTKGRDNRAIGELITRHGPVVMSACRRRLKNEPDCEDAFQATFLTLIIKAKWIRQRESVAGWLHRVAIRVAIDLQRANARRNTNGDLDVSNEQVVDNERTLMIEEELARLPANYRNAIVLCHLKGYNSHEAADILAVPRNTVNSWLVRGRKLLRKRLGKQGISLSLGGLISLVNSLSGTSNSIQAGLIQETTCAASLYASGSPIASATAATLAKATVSKMTIITLAKTTVIAIAISVLLFIFVPTMAVSSLSAQTVFFDDFKVDEMNDGLPDRWLSFEDRAILRISDESLVVSGHEYAAAFADQHFHSDVSVVTRLHIMDGDFAGVSARFTPGAEIDNYFAALTTDGSLLLGGGTPDGDVIELDQANTSIDVSAGDVFIRLDVFGPTLRAWAWNVGEEMPSDPLVEATDVGATSGTIAAFAGDFDGQFPVSAEFRFVEATVPEPSTLPAALIGLFASVCIFLRQRS